MMLSIYLYSLVSVLIVSLISLVGILTLSLKEDTLRKYLFLLVSLAVGALLGDAFIHLIPQASSSMAVIVGILIFFVLEKVLHWHHHRLEEGEMLTIHPTGQMILISDGVHNFIDGLIIGASYLVSLPVGVATTLAVILHEIPQEIGDFGVLLHSGYSTTKALWLNFLSALAAVAGVLIALTVGGAGGILTFWLIPIAAGGFIYIAMSDLIPEIHKTKEVGHSVLQFVAILIGILTMILLLYLE